MKKFQKVKKRKYKAEGYTCKHCGAGPYRTAMEVANHVRSNHGSETKSSQLAEMKVPPRKRGGPRKQSQIVDQKGISNGYEENIRFIIAGVTIGRIEGLIEKIAKDTGVDESLLVEAVVRVLRSACIWKRWAEE